MTEHRLAASGISSTTEQALPPELQNVVQILCDTYDAIDLRIETTLGTAEADFLASMPEVKEREAELRQLVKFLISDLRMTTEATSSQQIILRFAYQDQGDLVEQLLSGANARLVVVPADSDITLHANIQGSTL